MTTHNKNGPHRQHNMPKKHRRGQAPTSGGHGRTHAVLSDVALRVQVGRFAAAKREDQDAEERIAIEQATRDANAAMLERMDPAEIAQLGARL